MLNIPISFNRKSYLKGEEAFCAKELKLFYGCKKPNGTLEKETVRYFVERKRKEFRKIASRVTGIDPGEVWRFRGLRGFQF